MSKQFLVRATVKGVELVKAGRWNGLAGPVTLTQADLEDAVRAYQDPEVDHAVIKLGHVDPMNDGAPAAGWVENLRLSQDKTTLLGDLVDMPQRLAGMLSDAYLRRSAELRREVVTPSGKRYGTVLTGLALLGVQPPAVKGLADVLEQYASEHPGQDDHATHARVDTIQLTDGDTPPVPHGTGAQPESGHVQAPQGATNTPTGEGADMDPKIREALLARFKLAADVTDEQILAALEAAEDDQEPQSGEPAGTAEPAAVAPTAGQAQAQAGQAQAASDGTVTIPTASWEALQRQVQTLSEAETQRANDAALDHALSEGRITPAELQGWRDGLTDPAKRPGTLHLLSALPQRVAVIELGDGNAVTGDTEIAKAWAAQADAMGL